MCGSERGMAGSGGPVSPAWLASPSSAVAPVPRTRRGATGGACAPAGAGPRPRRPRTGWGKPGTEAAEQRGWEELLPHLPEGGRLLWRALGDVRQFRRVLAEFGGRTLRVPAQVPPVAHPLRRRLGVLCLRRLVAALGGTEVYVPTCRALLSKLRQQEIIREFSRATAGGRSSVSVVAALAGKYALSDRRIWQILKTTARAPKGAALLRALPGLAGRSPAPEAENR